MGVSLPCKSRSPGILARDDPPRGTLWKERSRRGERAFVRIIAGQWKGRRIKTTAGEGYRPAMGRVREALFSMLAARGAVWEGMRVLDVFAGSGSLGWEALSRGARQACFLESDAGAVRLLHEQRALFGLNGQQARVLVGNALRVLAKPCTQPHDLVFFDPPYGRDLMLPALSLALARGWIAPQAFAMKKPLVATDVGAVAELVRPGLTGWLVPGQDIPAMAQAIQDALLRPDQTVLDNAYALARAELGWDRVMQRTLASYQRALG